MQPTGMNLATALIVLATLSLCFGTWQWQQAPDERRIHALFIHASSDYRYGPR